MVALSPPQIAPRDVLRSLGLEAAGDPQRLVGGWDTLLWRFRSPDGTQHVLRIHYLPLRDEFAARERIALEACEQAAIPAPRVERVGTFDGLPAMVLSWCEGTPMLSLLERKPWRIVGLAREFGRAQAAIHRVAAPSEFREGAPGDWINRVDEPYRDLAEHVASLRPSSSSLVHMDYHPLNVIVGPRGISGIIDWTYAAAGDPRADLARTEFTLLSAPLPPGPMRPIINLARSMVVRSWRAGYRDAAGGLPDYVPFMAWAGATLLAEEERVIDKPEVWASEQDLDAHRRMIDEWAARARIRAPARKEVDHA